MKLIKNGEVAQGRQTYVVEIQRIVTIEIPVVAGSISGAKEKALELFRSNEKLPHAKSWMQGDDSVVNVKPRGNISPEDWLEKNYGGGE